MANFEINPERQEIICRLYDECESLDRGQLMSHEMIEQVTGIMRQDKGMLTKKMLPNSEYYGIVREVCKLIERRRNISTWMEMSEGWYLLTKAQQFNLPKRRAEKALRQTTKAERSILALMNDKLTFSQRNQCNMQVNAIQETKRRIKEQVATNIIFSGGRTDRRLPPDAPRPDQSRP